MIIRYWVISGYKATNCIMSVAPKSTQWYIIGTFSDVFEMTDSVFRYLMMPLLPRRFGFFIKESGKLCFINMQSSVFCILFKRTVGSDSKIIYISVFACVCTYVRMELSSIYVKIWSSGVLLRFYTAKHISIYSDSLHVGCRVWASATTVISRLPLWRLLPRVS